MSRLIWILLLGSIGCATLEIAPGEHPAIPPQEGVLAIGIEADTLIYMNVVGRGSAASFTINPIYRGSNLRAFHVPAGEYCIQQLTFQSSTAVFDPEPCFQVVAGAVTLTGFVESGERIARASTQEEVQRLFEQHHPSLASAFEEKRFVEIAFPTDRGVPFD